MNKNIVLCVAMSGALVGCLAGCDRDNNGSGISESQTQAAMRKRMATKRAKIAATHAPEPELKFVALTPTEVDKRRKETNFFVYDNNTKDRYAKGHVPGARWADPTELTAAMLPPDKTATLVFYCANPECSACHVGAQAALKLGYKNVYIMPAGIAGWESAKLPTDKTA